MTAAFRGIFAIPVTPFDSSGAVDHGALADVVEFTLDCGAHGLVMPVNVSEFFTLDDDERRAVVTTTVRVNRGRVPLVASVTGASTAQAARFAAHAADSGADAVIAMPPYVKRGDWPELVEYFTAIAAAGLPVFVQNAEGPAGTPMSAAQLSELAATIDGVSWFKEETVRSSQVISDLLARGGAHVSGVMGGKGSRFLLDEYPRGICGTMPGCEFTDLHVALWNALEGDQPAIAAEIYRFLLPLVGMEDQYGGAAFCKEVLRRRGVLTSTAVREPGSPRLDREASVLLDQFLAAATTWMVPSKPRASPDAAAPTVTAEA
ncbi:dihydrodipicolinate synthase family protein [Phytohabitans kaempferiae]|uniref:Dihydrodipicolinate synthase family protein n=1 Tax=Phytohabitans kaempferiae TaxID=1620943 RepID=A0ABV6M4C1_9ACTN